MKVTPKKQYELDVYDACDQYCDDLITILEFFVLIELAEKNKLLAERRNE